MSDVQVPATREQEDSSVDDLLEESWSSRGRPVRGRELKIEIMVTAAFLAAVTMLVSLSHGLAAPDPVAALLVLAYAYAARVEFPVGAAIFSPMQLFFVPLFAVAPAQLVPLLVFAGLVIAALTAAATGRAHIDRIAFCGGDALHALGPAIVIVALAGGHATEAGAGVLLLALVAQFACDFGSSSLHEVLVMRVTPSVHVRLLGQVWAVDAALSSVGLLAATVAANSTPWAALAPLPLVGLFGVIATDRTRKVEAAHDRLRALQHERARVRSVVRRLGEAFATGLDLDALRRVVTHTVAEALEGDVARAQGVAYDTITHSLDARQEAAACAALAAAEAELQAGDAPCAEAERAGFHAIAATIASVGEQSETVSVARTTPFSWDERDLLVYLCEQAGVSAANAALHETLQLAESQMRHQALHDGLTGLANRTLFTTRVGAALHGVVARDSAILFIDLDGFKLVNDQLGHAAGDQFLVVTAQRLAGCLRDGDTAARFGGDEFALLVEGGLGTPGAADLIAERILRALSAPVQIAGERVSVTGSVGITFLAPGLESEELLRRADKAMYDAKRGGGRRAVTAPDDQPATADITVQDLRAEQAS